MKNQATFKRVKGAEAYSIWFGYLEGDTEYFDAMMTTELDLELIIGSSGEVYANRSNLPFPQNLMFRNSGAWDYTPDCDNLSEHDMLRLELVCRNFAFN